jgi:hypothetical protein
MLRLIKKSFEAKTRVKPYVLFSIYYSCKCKLNWYIDGYTGPCGMCVSIFRDLINIYLY